jgi:hypothetical protein
MIDFLVSAAVYLLTLIAGLYLFGVLLGSRPRSSRIEAANKLNYRKFNLLLLLVLVVSLLIAQFLLWLIY